MPFIRIIYGATSWGQNQINCFNILLKDLSICIVHHFARCIWPFLFRQKAFDWIMQAIQQIVCIWHYDVRRHQVSIIEGVYHVLKKNCIWKNDSFICKFCDPFMLFPNQSKSCRIGKTKVISEMVICHNRLKRKTLLLNTR